MTKFIGIAAGAAFAILAGCAAAPDPFAPAAARISIAATSPDRWTVTYTAPAPTTELVFARQPDASRTTDWIPGPGFEIVRLDNLERIRRTDGAPFSEAVVGVPPRYRELPMDYAPFSPFGDGGALTYSGRYFACAGPCPDDAIWQMRLDAPGRTILVDGQRHADRATWIDADSGRNVYVGETAPVETADFLAVIDKALPENIREQLSEQLPGFMHFFAERMGDMPDRPMLFASYDLAHAKGWGRQGGTLPGQVFVHFYGAVWPEEMAKPGFAGSLAWHFAHEAAHLYQGQIYISGEGAWIHEGGAEALAAIAMRAQGHTEAASTHIAASAETCRTKIGARSLHAALAAGAHDLAYACGLQVNLAIDTEVRRAAPASDGLFTVWQRYRERVKGRDPTEADFFLAIADVGGAALSARIREMVSAPSTGLALAAGEPW